MRRGENLFNRTHTFPGRNLSPRLRAGDVSTMNYIPLNDGCVRACCKRSKMYALIREKKIVARKLGTRTIVEVESIDKWLASLPRLHSEDGGQHEPR